MPPKPPPAPLTPAQESLIDLFSTFSVSPTRAEEVARNAKQATIFSELVETYKNGGGANEWDEEKGKMVLVLIAQGGKLDNEGRGRVLRKIGEGRFGRSDQVLAGIKYVETHPKDINDADFERAGGVGINISLAEIPELVSKQFDVIKPASWDDLGKALGALKQTDLKWASAVDVKNALEAVFLERFGTKEAAREKKNNAPKPTKASAASAAPTASSSAVPAPALDNSKTMFTEGWLSRLHAPGGNPQIHPELREAHLKATGGRVMTRFPPEPNGFLHIGHSKAITVNFGYAAYHGGKTYLRYDDTNPSAEEGRYFESILEMVRWLGFEPWTITYSSDHFQRLYDFATELIRRDKAYVCHCTAEEQLINRGGKESQARTACSHRSRPIEESLVEFERMRKGEYKKGEATLRMKQDLNSGNPQMWDGVAYRIVPATHHRTGDEWCIYPTYDFTHCLVDSFENISHSLCTTEFITARESYDWLCDALEVYKPRQSEYGRLNIQGTVMSKRKIKKLVEDNYVNGWDDPRLYTLIALRRRGIPPGAIISFIQSLGVSTSSSNIQLVKFESAVRSYLESSAPRLNFVLHPIKCTISNVADDYRVLAEKPLHPKDPKMGSYEIAFTKTFFIDEDDFRMEDSKDYFRMAPGKTVGLLGAPFPVTCEEVKVDAEGKVVELIVRLENEKPKKPKAYIQWVSLDPLSSSPTIIDETRIFNPLFNSDDPAALDDYLKDINPNSLTIVKGALIEPAFWSLAKKAMIDARKESVERTAKALAESKGAEKAEEGRDESVVKRKEGDDTPVATVDQLIGLECIRFQGLRVAYFTVDKESKLGCLEEEEGVKAGRREGDVLILNRIVSLKEMTSKKTV